MRKTLILTILLISFLFLSCKYEQNFDDDVELCRLLSDMRFDDQNIRKMELFKNGNKKQKDSLWEIQRQIDEKNTKMLMAITKKRGWVSKNELGCEDYIAPVIIFRHAPEKYFDEISALIEIEIKSGRMGNLDYMFIDNHLKGRPDFDFKIVE